MNDKERLVLLRRAMQKNWWLGIGACLSFLLAGRKLAALLVGTLILIWNGVLAAVARLVDPAAPAHRNVRQPSESRPRGGKGE